MVHCRLPLLVMPMSLVFTYWALAKYTFINYLISLVTTYLICFWAAWKFSCYVGFIVQNHLSPSGKTVIITGCDSGLGFVTALELNASGFRVIAGVKDVFGPGARNLKRSSERSDRLHLIEIDVTRDEAELSRDIMEQVMEILDDSGDCLWGLVNNAGVLSVGPIDWGDFKTSVEPLINVNILGTIKMTRLFLPLLKQANTGLKLTATATLGARIVNISSVQGRMSLPWTPVYATTKSAIIAFSNNLRLNVARFGIKVTTILPYKYRTPMGQTEQLIDSLDVNWRTSQPDVKSSYGDWYFYRLRELLGRINNSGPAPGEPFEVAAKIRLCLVVPDPPNEIVCSPHLLYPLWSLVRYIPQEYIDLFFDYIDGKYLSP